MASKKGKILCKKCVKTKCKNAKKVKGKESRSRGNISPVSKHKKHIEWRSVSLHRHPVVASALSSSPYRCSSKRLRAVSPENVKSLYDSVCSSTSRFSQLSRARSGILKRRVSSGDILTSYLNSGMEEVASFIVESALRFGKEHGVVVPEKGRSGVYQIASPSSFRDKKARKIRFRIPEETFGYEDAKKAMWRRGRLTCYGKAAASRARESEARETASCASARSSAGRQGPQEGPAEGEVEGEAEGKPSCEDERKSWRKGKKGSHQTRKSWRKEKGSHQKRKSRSDSEKSPDGGDKKEAANSDSEH